MGKSAKRPVKKRVEGGGRVTPKKSAGTGASPSASAAGSPSGGRSSGRGGAAPTASTRYTPPTPTYAKVSPRWVPIVMFALLGLGFVVIFLNYVALLPGGTNNWYLLAGLGFILGGIITATQLH